MSLETELARRNRLLRVSAHEFRVECAHESCLVGLFCASSQDATHQRRHAALACLPSAGSPRRTLRTFRTSARFITHQNGQFSATSTPVHCVCVCTHHEIRRTRIPHAVAWEVGKHRKVSRPLALASRALSATPRPLQLDGLGRGQRWSSAGRAPRASWMRCRPGPSHLVQASQPRTEAQAYPLRWHCRRPTGMREETPCLAPFWTTITSVCTRARSRSATSYRLRHRPPRPTLFWPPSRGA